MLFNLLSFSSCTKEIKEDKDVDSNEIEGKVEIWTSGVAEGLIENYIGKFNEEQSKITINNTYLNEAEFNTKVIESFNSGVSMPDIMIINDVSVNKVKTIESKFTITPWYITPRTMFYRTDIFQGADIKGEDIKTWDDYIEAGKRISEHNGGMVKLLPLNISNDSNFFRQLLNQQGGSYYDKDGKINLSSEQAVKAMTVLKKFYGANVFYKTSNEEDIITAANKNEIASIPYGTNLIDEMRDKLKEQAGKWGIMNMPAFEAGGMTESTENKIYICINKEYSHNKAAVELKSFLQNNHDIEKNLIVNKGVFPVTSELYAESFMDEADLYFNNQKLWRYLDVTIKNAPEFPALDRVKEIETEIMKAQEAIVIQNQDIRSVLGSINNKISETKSKN